MCSPDAIDFKVARREVSWLEREVGVVQHPLAEVIQAALVVRKLVIASAVRELPLQVDQTVLFGVEQDRDRPVFGTDASGAVDADSPFVRRPSSVPGPGAPAPPPSPPPAPALRNWQPGAQQALMDELMYQPIIFHVSSSPLSL